ncbi:MAG: NUDIX domain-containing protein [Lachnospiraceae bacterium]|jgi:Isopentenyldiphosphate isomerase|nr:NUDIX domain-containing protein [Lachnospiraceae bacterium]
MEKWDLYTKYREKTGKEHIRGQMIPEGFYHLVVHVWIRNHRGEYLISQRSASRPTFPLMWECVGGSVLKGESSIDGALREVKEEVGLDLEQKDGKLLFSKIRGSDVRYECKVFNDIMDVWLFEYDGALQLESATTDEVAACRWMTVSEIRKLYEDKKLVQTLDYFFCAMEAGEPDYGHIIGKVVRGTVDRPLGSSHPNHPEMVYLVNYGYVDDVFADDGTEQDVYLFGTDKPLKKFEGKVIAVWHRFDDVEDKWIVSLDGENVTAEKILGDISFQEQYFYGKLYM